MTTARRRLLAVLALAVVPWTVVFAHGTPTLFFPVGSFTPSPVSFTAVWDYYLRYTAFLPQYLAAWGIGVALLGVALLSALSGVVWREDARVTGAVLVLAGVSNLAFAGGFLPRVGYTAVPVGTLLSWTVAWWYYRRDIRRMLAVTEYPGEPK
jgi:uncharacterized protein (TIGR04206 family)